MRINNRTIRRVLTALGVIGVPLTSYISIKCSKKAEERDDKKEKFKCYIPAIVSGAATCICIGANHRVSSKEIATLTATATYAIANRDKLEEAIKPYFSKEEHDDLVENAKKSAVTKSVKSELYEQTGNGYLRFIEGCSGRAFQSSLDAVTRAEKMLSERLRHGVCCDLNDFFRYLGLSSTDYGEKFVWLADETYANYGVGEPLEFRHIICEDSDMQPVCLIDVFQYPEEYPMLEGDDDA